MSDSLQVSQARSVGDVWRWRDREGGFWSPHDMETRHLFYTLRMIWNNFMPAHMQVGRANLYTFSAHYTRHYLGEAILHLGSELNRRKDMRADWKREYAQMRSWFSDWSEVDQGGLPAPRQALAHGQPA